MGKKIVILFIAISLLLGASPYASECGSLGEEFDVEEILAASSSNFLYQKEAFIRFSQVHAFFTKDFCLGQYIFKAHCKYGIYILHCSLVV